jgi:hypothetical protein
VVYRKGELSAAGVDRGWPHQVAIPAAAHSENFKLIEKFCESLSKCPRGHCVVRDDAYWNVLCFSEKADAEKFKLRFGGEDFDPQCRGRGANWWQWREPKPKTYGRG